jgi:hypothetical protein
VKGLSDSNEIGQCRAALAQLLLPLLPHGAPSNGTRSRAGPRKAGAS